MLNAEDLKHIFIISDGLGVNGSELAGGFESELDGVTVTGGLAGDMANFDTTLTGLNEKPSTGNIVAVGFYGPVKIGYGSVGGWDVFGPTRTITKSEGNVLYELDHQSALQLYKKYLGEKAQELPGSALHFPLSITTGDQDKPKVRTILSVDEASQSMTFAGDLPEGAKAKLMKANFEKLIDGATDAAESAILQGQTPELAILVSCVGRRLVLDQRIEEEIESVKDMLDPQTTITGFYSYGELAPFAGEVNCELHNQTMTVTLLSEEN